MYNVSKQIKNFTLKFGAFFSLKFQNISYGNLCMFGFNSLNFYFLFYGRPTSPKFVYSNG